MEPTPVHSGIAAESRELAEREGITVAAAAEIIKKQTQQPVEVKEEAPVE